MDDDDDPEFLLALETVFDQVMMEAQSKKTKVDYFLGVKGLILVDDFVTEAEETQLLEHINQESWNTSLSRRTQHYGYIYDYTSKNASEKTTPIPEWALFVVDRLMEQGLLQERPDQLIVNEYKPGQGIAAHTDSVSSFRDGIVSLSLGSDILMDFVKGSTVKKEGHLKRRSVICMHDEARYKWRHGITQRKSDNNIPRGTRVSMTFRKMK